MFGALEEEKEQVENALLMNGYPKRFIHRSAPSHPPCTMIMEKPHYGLPSICQKNLRTLEEGLGKTPDRT